MKKIILALIVFAASVSLVNATPMAWDYTTNLLQPFRALQSSEIRGAFFTATSTSNNTFPNLVSTNATTTNATSTNLYVSGTLNAPGVIPQGGIIMWSGSIASIPSGWELADGSCSITCPDLRDRFIVGARQDSSGAAKTNVLGTLQQTGGATSHTVSVESLSLAFSTYKVSNTGTVDAVAGDSGITVDEFLGHTLDAVPPFYALAFIIKI